VLESFLRPLLELARMGTGGVDDLARQTRLAVRRKASHVARLAVGMEELAVGGWSGRVGGIRTGELDKR